MAQSTRSKTNNLDIEGESDINKCDGPLPEPNASHDNWLQQIINLIQNNRQEDQLLRQEDQLARQQDKKDLQNLIQNNRQEDQLARQQDKKELQNLIQNNRQEDQLARQQDKTDLQNLIQNNKKDLQNTIQFAVDALNDKIDSFNSTLENKICEVSRQCQQNSETLETKLNEMETINNELSANVTNVNNKIDKVEQHINKIETEHNFKFTDINEDIGKLEIDLNNKIVKIDEELNQSMNSKLAVISNRVLVNETDIKGIEKKIIQSVEQKINNHEFPIAIQSNISNPNSIELPSHLTFTGRENPPKFLRSCQDYFQSKNIKSEEVMCKLIRSGLIENAADWMHSINVWPQQWIEFKNIFYNRYWTKEIQFIEKRKLLEGVWKPLGKLTMEEYASRRIANLKLFEPPVAEDEAIFELTRHFPYHVQNLVKTNQCKSFSQFMIILGQIDSTDREINKNQRYNHITYQNYRSNDQNNTHYPNHSEIETTQNYDQRHYYRDHQRNQNTGNTTNRNWNGGRGRGHDNSQHNYDPGGNNCH